ncbi:putative baseplate assembly protein [Desulfurivibrio sp. D14AmB]|uniref:putative baseplate assembly protein n=1 Tax=Desulfurivibrio sp. D14AmB TaxID=3374370 RepID=UPI00376F2C93
MPIQPPRLDDRRYEDLVEELLARVPAHTPEWVPQPAGDPGRTLLELFAWLADTVLYRANLIPERQRLAFLQLLGMPLRPARAAHGLIALSLDEERPVSPVVLAPEARLPGPVPFETLAEVTVLPVRGECYYKRALSTAEQTELADLIDGLRQFHKIKGDFEAYVTTGIFHDGRASRAGLDLVKETADRSLWIALLAEQPEDVAAVRAALTGDGAGGRLLNVGIAPAQELPAAFDEMRPAGHLEHSWWISTAELVDDQPLYSPLRRLEDSTGEFTRCGVERLVLPGDVNDFGILEGDARKDANAGVGDRPPRLDDPERLARLVAWLRLRPAAELESLALSWVGINAVEIDQRRTSRGIVIGHSDGSGDQLLQLPTASVEVASFVLEVEESGRGYVTWQPIADLALAGRDDAVYLLDPEAGTVRFGNGIQGRIPEAGRRIRVARMRAGGGLAGNLPAGTLQEIEARGPDGRPVSRKLQVVQGVATDGGADSETLDEAQRRIPARLSHRNRAVTGDDYRTLALETPGTALGRVEVLPRFLPRQRRFNVPGVVAVMVLPAKERREAPNPRPDQPLIRKVHDYLSARRPLATELYVIGCEYLPLGIGVGITVRAGFGREQVEHEVRRALYRHLWPLAPHGPRGEGWPLGMTVNDQELAVVIAQVGGVDRVRGVNLFTRRERHWQLLPRTGHCQPVDLTLREWQLPELLAVAVRSDGVVPEAVQGPAAGSAGAGGGEGADGEQGSGGAVALPVVPEIC